MHSGYTPVLHTAASTIGWVAAVTVLAAYAMLMSGRLRASSGRYLVLNAAGSAGLALSMTAAHAWQSVVVNAVWMAFALVPLGRKLREIAEVRRRHDATTSSSER